MKIALRTVLIGLYLVLLGGLSYSQDEDLDSIFEDGAFDTSVSESQTQDKVTQLEYLYGLTLLSDSSLQVPLNRWAYGGIASLGGKTFIKATKPDTGALFVSWSFRQVLSAGTNDDFFRQGYSYQNIDPSELTFALSEFHLSFDVNKVLFIRLGNQLLSWGSSVYWSPADFVNRQKLDSTSGADLRSGVPGIRFHLPVDTSNFFIFLDLSRVVQNGTPQDFSQKTGLAWRADTTVFGLRLGTNGYYVPQQGVENLPLIQGGLDLTTALWGIDLYSEGSVQWLGTEAPKGELAAGFSRAFGDAGEWSLSSEGFWNPQGVGDRDVPNFGSPDFSRFTSLYWGQYYLWAQVKRSKLLDSHLDLSASGVGNLADGSWKATIQSDWTFTGLPGFSVYGALTGGGDHREFTRGGDGKSWYLGLRSLISF